MHTLFPLLRLALWGDPVSLPPVIDWEALLREAEHQTVAGLLADAVGLLPEAQRPPREVRLRLASVAMRYERMNARSEEVLEQIVEAWSAIGVRAVVMKGLSVGSRYREPRHRATGDLDLFFHSEAERLRADAWAAEHGQDVCDDSTMHRGYTYMGVPMENHSSLREFSYPPYERTLRRIVSEQRATEWPRRTIGRAEVLELPPTLYALFLLCHKAGHAMGAGIGLRQVCDWAVFLRAERGRIDAALFQRWVRALGMGRVAEAFGRVCVDCLGLPEACLPFPLRRNDERGLRTLLTVIREGGNFGKTYFKGGPSFFREGCIKMRAYARFLPLWPVEALARYLTMVRNGFRRIQKSR